MSSLSRPYLGTRSPSIIQRTGSEMPEQTGIFVGVVKQIDTTTRTGRLWVYITQMGGPDPNNPTNWKLVSYASPFFGQTTGPQGAAEFKEATLNQNVFGLTSQSYGFHMIPPDIENKVLCCFTPGTSEGFWFACLNKSASIYMTPALGSIDYRYIDPVSIPPNLPPLNSRKKYPVGDWNENLARGYTAPTKDVLKPLHVLKTIQLFNQGLDEDETRGTITSSSQRDPVSSVFGFSTPGRPVSRQDSAFTDDRSAEPITTRVGGHSLVMDDGDSTGENNLVRLKTSAGHQILMHDTDGLIYISNSTGTAWVELTKGGDVLIYGANDLSVRTGGNLMMHSDKSISFFAADSIKMASGKTIAMETKEIFQTAMLRMSIFGKKIQARSASTFDLASASSLSIRSGGKVAINGSGIALNGSGSAPNIQNPPPIQKFSLPDVQMQQYPLARKFTVVPGKLISTNYKVPTHEPYFRQGLKQAIAELVAVSDTYEVDINGDPISPSVIEKPQGPNAAANTELYDAAPEAIFLDQPEPEGSVGVLDSNEIRALTAQIGYTESRGDYSKVEPSGFIGKYQFSVDDLETLGYIKEGLPATIDAVTNPNNWVNKDNIANLEDFLQSKELQEQAMFNLIKNNYAALQSTGAIVKSMAKDVISGLLAVSHLAGPNGATTWFKTGRYSINANGYTAADYYNRGKYSNTQTDIYGPNQ